MEQPSGPSHVRRRWRAHHVALVSLAVIAGLLAVGRILLNPFVARHTRQVLAGLEGYKGDFSDVSVSILKLSYTINDLKLVKVPTPAGADVKRPFFYAKEIRIGLHWRELIHRRELVASVDLDTPKLNIIAGKTKDQSQVKLEDPHLGEKIKKLSPLDVQRVQLKNAEVAFTDDTAETSPALWLHDLDVTVENLATRVGLAHGEPTQLAASGTLQKTGQVSIFMTADPLAKSLAFSGRAAVEGLDVHDIGNFLVQKAELAPKKGTIDVFAEFDAHDGRLSGGVKPLLKDMQVSAGKPGFFPKVKAWVANAGLKIFSDRVPGRKAATALIPIKGDISAPKTDLWPTVWGVLRNAFVEGLESGFANLPGKEAKKTGALPQARSAQGGHR